MFDLVCFVMNMFLKWFLICGLGRVGQKRWPSIYLVLPGSDHQQYIWCPYGREYFANLQYLAEQYFFIGGVNIDIPEQKFWSLCSFPNCTLLNELVINMFSCLRVMRLSGLKVRFHTFSSNSFLLLLRTFERICWSAQIVGKCFEKWAETQVVKMVVCKAQY